MIIELKEITVRELTTGYQVNEENGVVGYGGKLDIRPPYQREFIYKDKQRDAVIDTITKDFPLNVMYWAVREDGNFEVIDGQQRTISVSQFVEGDFSFNDRYFHNLQKDEQEQILSSSESGIENCMPAKKSIATYEDSKKHGFIFEEGQVIYKEMKLWTS